MALQLACGFELNPTVANIAQESPNLSWFGGVSTGASITTSNVQTGSRALQQLFANQTDLVYGALSSSHIQFSKAAIYIPTLPNVECAIMDLTSSNGVYEGVITLTAAGNLRLYYSNTSSGFTQLGSDTPISTGAYHYIELKVDDTGGNASTVVEAKIDGSTIGSGTVAILNTSTGIVGGVADLDAYGWSGATPASGSIIFDNWVINDGSGSLNTYVGDQRLLYVDPNAAGDVNTFATQTGGTAGAANNFTRVNENPPDDATTFNGSSTLNQEDLFNSADPSVQSYDTVNFVQVMGRFRNNTADATAVAKLEIEKAAAGTKAQGGAITPNSTAWATSTPARSLITYLDPDGGTWTNTTVASMQFGYKLTTANVNRVEFTKAWSIIGYTPGTPPSTGVGSLLMMGIGS